METSRWKKARTLRLFTASYFSIRSLRSSAKCHLQARIDQMTACTHEQPIELKTFYTVINNKKKT